MNSVQLYGIRCIETATACFSLVKPFFDPWIFNLRADTLIKSLKSIQLRTNHLKILGKFFMNIIFQFFLLCIRLGL